MVSMEVMKSAIVDKEEELRNKVKVEKIIERELKIEKISTDVASIITGVRRCGKSILVFLLAQKENAAYASHGS